MYHRVQVTGISLSSNNLQGVLAESLGDLDTLTGLSLGRQGGLFFPYYAQSLFSMVCVSLLLT